MKVDISNVTAALANLTSRGAPEPVVKVTLQLNENGHITVTNAIAYGEVKDDSLTGMLDRPFFAVSTILTAFVITGKLKNLFGGGSSSSSSTPEGTEPATASASPSSSAATPLETPATASEAKKAEKNTVPLIVEVTYTSTRPLTIDEKNRSRGRYVRSNLTHQEFQDFNSLWRSS